MFESNMAKRVKEIKRFSFYFSFKSVLMEMWIIFFSLSLSFRFLFGTYKGNEAKNNKSLLKRVMLMTESCWFQRHFGASAFDGENRNVCRNETSNKKNSKNKTPNAFLQWFAQAKSLTIWFLHFANTWMLVHQHIKHKSKSKTERKNKMRILFIICICSSSNLSMSFRFKSSPKKITVNGMKRCKNQRREKNSLV